MKQQTQDPITIPAPAFAAMIFAANLDGAGPFPGGFPTRRGFATLRRNDPHAWGNLVAAFASIRRDDPDGMKAELLREVLEEPAAGALPRILALEAIPVAGLWEDPAGLAVFTPEEEATFARHLPMIEGSREEIGEFARWVKRWRSALDEWQALPPSEQDRRRNRRMEDEKEWKRQAERRAEDARILADLEKALEANPGGIGILPASSSPELVKAAMERLLNAWKRPELARRAIAAWLDLEDPLLKEARVGVRWDAECFAAAFTAAGVAPEDLLGEAGGEVALSVSYRSIPAPILQVNASGIFVDLAVVETPTGRRLRGRNLLLANADAAHAPIRPADLLLPAA